MAVDKVGIFRHQHLVNDDLVSLLSSYDSLITLDLSYNNISRFHVESGVNNFNNNDNDKENSSSLMYISLIGLDLSFNQIASNLKPNNTSNIPSAISNNFSIFSNLIELRLQSNSLTSLTTISFPLFLKHLDLSYNQLEVIQGLEQNINLETLLLEGNQIASIAGLRALSLNICLTELSIQYNPFTSIVRKKSKKLSGIASTTEHIISLSLERVDSATNELLHNQQSSHLQNIPSSTSSSSKSSRYDDQHSKSPRQHLRRQHHTNDDDYKPLIMNIIPSLIKLNGRLIIRYYKSVDGYEMRYHPVNTINSNTNGASAYSQFEADSVLRTNASRSRSFPRNINNAFINQAHSRIKNSASMMNNDNNTNNNSHNIIQGSSVYNNHTPVTTPQLHSIQLPTAPTSSSPSSSLSIILWRKPPKLTPRINKTICFNIKTKSVNDANHSKGNSSGGNSQHAVSHIHFQYQQQQLLEQQEHTKPRFINTSNSGSSSNNNDTTANTTRRNKLSVSQPHTNTTTTPLYIIATKMSTPLRHNKQLLMEQQKQKQQLLPHPVPASSLQSSNWISPVLRKISQQSQNSNSNDVVHNTDNDVIKSGVNSYSNIRVWSPLKNTSTAAAITTTSPHSTTHNKTVNNASALVYKRISSSSSPSSSAPSSLQHRYSKSKLSTPHSSYHSPSANNANANKYISPHTNAVLSNHKAKYAPSSSMRKNRQKKLIDMDNNTQRQRKQTSVTETTITAAPHRRNLQRKVVPANDKIISATNVDVPRSRSTSFVSNYTYNTSITNNSTGSLGNLEHHHRIQDFKNNIINTNNVNTMQNSSQSPRHNNSPRHQPQQFGRSTSTNTNNNNSNSYGAIYLSPTKEKSYHNNRNNFRNSSANKNRNNNNRNASTTTTSSSCYSMLKSLMETEDSATVNIYTIPTNTAVAMSTDDTHQSPLELPYFYNNKKKKKSSGNSVSSNSINNSTIKNNNNSYGNKDNDLSYSTDSASFDVAIDSHSTPDTQELSQYPSMYSTSNLSDSSDSDDGSDHSSYSSRSCNSRSDSDTYLSVSDTSRNRDDDDSSSSYTSNDKIVIFPTRTTTSHYSPTIAASSNNKSNSVNNNNNENSSSTVMFDAVMQPQDRTAIIKSIAQARRNKQMQLQQSQQQQQQSQGKEYAPQYTATTSGDNINVDNSDNGNSRKNSKSKNDINITATLPISVKNSKDNTNNSNTIATSLSQESQQLSLTLAEMIKKKKEILNKILLSSSQSKPPLPK